MPKDSWFQSSSDRQLVRGSTEVQQLLVLGIVSNPVENLTVLSVLRYFDVWLRYVRPELVLIDDINVSWFIHWHVETMSGEMELVLMNCL